MKNSKKMTKQEIENEIGEMVRKYHYEGYTNTAFFVAPENSLWDEKNGDSARYWELQNQLNKLKTIAK